MRAILSTIREKEFWVFAIWIIGMSAFGVVVDILDELVWQVELFFK